MGLKVAQDANPAKGAVLLDRRCANKKTPQRYNLSQRQVALKPIKAANMKEKYSLASSLRDNHQRG
ncbi:MAG: hypothetical protein CVU50_05240 [Candidatus Cloacimonetes bacterium HGW-Cloacimonetes-3]|nr:MAG: hypothetical protein CVU50_05240 [Candidatus Cloacimonetes bacterium HGW-Cloacimonetes-3]